ncbi:NuA4-domain-containing protein [Clavulina sp. PMI_390]|nr:NuA4-domain-containing protein [Clavulina sp. PMI_390]
METPADPKAAYEVARKDLIAALTKKRAVDKSLASLEQNLYAFEQSYLQETSSSGGNIITGFEAYLKPSAANKKKGHDFLESDRIFSNSSMTTQRSQEMQTGPPTPPPGDYPNLPQQVTLQPQAGAGRDDASVSTRRNTKRSRREREGTKGTSDGEESVVTTSRRTQKRVRVE